MFYVITDSEVIAFLTVRDIALSPHFFLESLLLFMHKSEIVRIIKPCKERHMY